MTYSNFDVFELISSVSILSVKSAVLSKVLDSLYRKFSMVLLVKTAAHFPIVLYLSHNFTNLYAVSKIPAMLRYHAHDMVGFTSADDRNRLETFLHR